MLKAGEELAGMQVRIPNQGQTPNPLSKMPKAESENYLCAISEFLLLMELE
jgi:hypothetical protein